MKDFFQQLVRNKVITAAVSIVFGIILIVGQGSAVAQLVRILGFLLLTGAAVGLITYFVGKENRRDPTTLTLSILGILASLVFIYSPWWLVDIFPVVMGVVLIINSVANISGLVSAPAKAKTFPAAMVLSILTLVLGFVAVFHPSSMANAIILYIGIVYLCNGISDLVMLSALK